MALTPWLSHYKTDFELARRRRQESIQFDDLRCEAFDRFLLLGFPTTRDEEWRLTDIARLAETYFTVGARPPGHAPGAEIAALPLSDLSGVELVFVNGYFVPQRSTGDALPTGALVAPLAATLASNPDDVGMYFARVARVDRLAFVALNTALFEDGACIVVPAHTVVDKPIHVRFISTGDADIKPAMSLPRVLVVLDEGSQATIVESYTGPDGVDYFTNAVTEIVLGEGAALDQYKVQHEGTAAYHIAATHVVAAWNATYSAHSIGLGGALVRNEVVTLLGGKGGKCTLNGLHVADAHGLVDNHTTIDHAMPNCVSRQICREILGEQARGVSCGRNIFRAGARKTRATQINRALLLSRDARMDAKPELEMLADEACCTQRVAVEQLDENPTAERRLLILRFAREALNRRRIPPLRSGVEDLLQRRLDRLLGGS